MIRLGVNIDHIATLRQARLETEPDPAAAAALCESAGADGITVHLREDRRHIQDRDVRALRASLKTKLNLEMAASEDILTVALEIKPDDACIVPEKRKELTTEGGLDAACQVKTLAPFIARLKKAGIRVSLFIDPIETQVRAAKETGADSIELHTGSYAEAFRRHGASSPELQKELGRLVAAGEEARRLGLELHGGHGLDYRNVVPVARIPGMSELNIGFAIIARSVFVGLDRAVREMKDLIE